MRSGYIFTCQGAPQAVLLRHVSGVLEEEGFRHRLAVDRDVSRDADAFFPIRDLRGAKGGG